MAFQSLCFGRLLGRGGQDELQKLNTNSLAQMQPRRTFIATWFFPLLCKGIRGDPPFSGTRHIPLEVGFPGLLPHIGKRLCILFYPNVLQPLTGLTCSPLFRPRPPQISRQKKKSRCRSRFKLFFLRLLSPKGFKEVAELFTSRDLACSSVPLDFKLFLPGCPGAGSNTCHHMQYGHNTLIPTGSRTQQKKAQAEDQTWKEQKTEELLLPSVSGTEKWTQGKRQGRGIITFIPILFPQFPTTFEANFPLIKYTINDSSRNLLCKTIPNSPDGIILCSAQYTCMYIYIHKLNCEHGLYYPILQIE